MMPARRRAGRVIRKRRRMVRAYLRVVGVELLPWQVSWMEAALSASPPVLGPVRYKDDAGAEALRLRLNLYSAVQAPSRNALVLAHG